MYQRMQAMLAQCEYTVEKANNTFEMNKQEQHNYDTLSQDIGMIQGRLSVYICSTIVTI